MKRNAQALLLILLFSFTACYGQAVQQGTSVETIQFKSKLTGKTLPYSVVLPPGHASPQNRTQTYPVLYLLHGLTGHYTDWLSKTKLKEYAAAYRLIIITPEGNDGWYTDAALVPKDKYESYILQELMPDVESRFRASKRREERAIAGLSMGGYGALKFGIKHPDKFIFAASMSGALDAATRADDYMRGDWETMRVSIRNTFGAAGNSVRAENDLHKLVRNIPAERLAQLPFFYLDCGTEDYFIEANREMAAILLERKIPHEFRQLPGKHDWTYWDAQVREILKLMQRKMNLGAENKTVGAGTSPLPAFFHKHTGRDNPCPYKMQIHEKIANYDNARPDAAPDLCFCRCNGAGRNISRAR